NKDGLFALSIVDNNAIDGIEGRNAKKLLVKAAVTAASTDNILTELLRYDQNIVNGIKSVIKEHNITDLILGLHIKSELSTSFLGELTESILERSRTTTFIYKSIQPLNTIKRHLIVVPDKAEKETGFPFWLIKVWNIARNTGSTLVFYSSSDTLNYIRQIQKIHPVPCEFEEFNDWQDFLVLSGKCQKNDNLIIILSRKDKLSYQESMEKVPSYLNRYFKEYSFILVYPIQVGIMETTPYDRRNPSLLEPIDEMGRTISRLFKRK